MHGNEKLGETTIQQKKDETQNKETKPEFLKENTLRVNLLKEIITIKMTENDSFLVNANFSIQPTDSKYSNETNEVKKK